MLRIAVGLAYTQLTHRGSKLVGALMGVSVAIILMFTQLGFQGALYDSAVSMPRAFDGASWGSSLTAAGGGDRLSSTRPGPVGGGGRQPFGHGRTDLQPDPPGISRQARTDCRDRPPRPIRRLRHGRR